jgi:hypothetical protein
VSRTTFPSPLFALPELNRTDEGERDSQVPREFA